MTTPDDSTATRHFARIADALVGRAGVTIGSGRKGFGSDALEVDGRIFAMARRGGLVLKLPADRVGQLIVSGVGRAFDAGQGRPMKEWVVIDHASARRWKALAEEALGFVGGKPRSAARGR
jgi:hypothetical protein